MRTCTFPVRFRKSSSVVSEAWEGILPCVLEREGVDQNHAGTLGRPVAQDRVDAAKRMRLHHAVDALHGCRI